MLYDVFICHASEDKDDFVRPLAERLKQNRIEVWYDEFSLKIGDSLRRSIDLGLAKSRYGIVVLSPSFFLKSWPQWELDGLVQRQNNALDNVILPIWHNITRGDIISFSPPLGDKYAIPSNIGVEGVVSKLLETIRPEGSTLLIARERLLGFGYEPPVVTDDWWLDAVEVSAANPLEETFQSPMGWGRWGFPLPPKGDNATKRGERLAWAAMQMMWQERANTLRISQITHPERVLDFIRSQPGLLEVCHTYLPFLIAYAPQLSIRGFGGEFEDSLEAWYNQSVAEGEERRKAKDRFGSGLTTSALPPACCEAVALRHPHFGFYRAANIACWFVQGELMGPPVKFYENIDYIAWMLSDQSKWMTRRIRHFLIGGVKDWDVWQWHEHPPHDYDFGFQPNPATGSLSHALYKAKAAHSFKLTDECSKDIETRLEFSATLLPLNESGSELTKRFLNTGFIEGWFNAKLRRQEKRKRESKTKKKRP